MSLQTRGFVPSEREVELGQAKYEFVPPVVEAAPVSSRRQSLSENLKLLDPRTLGVSPLPLIVIGVLTMLSEWDAFSFGVLAPDIQKSFGFDVGFLVALGTILQFVQYSFAPIAGYLADRRNRVRLLSVGSAIQSVSQIAAGVAPSVLPMVGSRVGGGVGGALTQPVGLPLITDYYAPEVRGRALSQLFIFISLGGTLGPVVAGQLGDAIGWRAALIVLGVATLVASLVALVLKHPVRGGLDRIAQGADVEIAQREQKAIGWAEGWRAAASVSSLRRIWYMTPFLVAGISILGPVLSLYYAVDFGVGSSGRGWLLGLNGAFGIVGLAFSSTIADRIIKVRPGRVFTLLAGMLVMNAVIMVGLVLSPWLWLSFAIQIPLAVAGSIALPAAFSLISLVVPPRIRGLGIQTMAPWQILGLVVVQAIFLAAPNLGIHASFLMLAGIMLVGATVVAGGAPGVERDIRAAAAASMADEISHAARAVGGNKILICTDVDVTYDSSQVLFNVDFQMEEGELVALLGTNGAGKSTLQRAICGIQEASNGAIFFDGEDITHRPPHLNAADGIVFMPGGAAVFPSLTVRDNLRSAGWLDSEELDSRVEHTLELFPVLRERLDVPAGSLSGGEQQMVALSQAFIMKPRLLMIDELSLGLAPAVVEQLLEIVRQINAAGTTVLLVEQSANVALTLARRAVFMEKGEIRFDGPTEELLGRGDLLRAVFLGGTGAGATGFVATHRTNPWELEIDQAPALQVEDVSLLYGGRLALDGVSLTVQPGSVLGVIGPNGAGKTSLFDVISGYTSPASGRVLIGGTDATGLAPDARARLGMVRSFQSAKIFPALTVREALAVGLERQLAVRSILASALWLPQVRKAEKRVTRRVDYLIDLLHLEAYADKFVGDLSTGTRRMIDIGCIMAAEPSLLLLDEPSSGLAQSEVEVLGPVVRRLAKETGCGVIVIEHDMPLVASLADEVAVLVLGRTLMVGDPKTVISHPEVVQAYLGTSEATINRSGTLAPEALAKTLSL